MLARPVPDLLESLREALRDRYAVEAEVGSGGMATVFRAEDLKHHRTVAIKLVRSDLAAMLGGDRFLREIEIAARLQHPHILPLYDSGSAGGLLYYVMPFVEGESLRDRLTREKQLPLADTLRIATEVAGALAYAHSQGVVHRDIKPENILLSGGTAVVADFGIARAVTAAGGGAQLTQTGTVMGTPAYMSPEQGTGVQELDGRSDQYSLACVVYEMLVGEPPFTGPTVQAVIARHSLDSVSPPSIVRNTIPDAVEAAILRALSKVPADRFPTTAMFAEALNTPSAATGAARRASLASAQTGRRPSRLALAVLAGVGVLALAAGLVMRRRAASGAPAGGLDPRHVAVLYFEDQSRDGKLGYLADGLTEALIAELSRIEPLVVTSQNGVRAYRHAPTPPDSVARALGAGTLVQGGVDEAGGRVRVTVRLVDGASGADYKRGSFELAAGNPLATRDTLVARVAAFLRERLGEELELRAARLGTSVATAWSLLEQAKRHRKDAEGWLERDSLARTVAAFQAADSLAAAAEAADPDWVDPTVLRGQIAYQRARLAADRRERSRWVDVATGHAERALAGAPTDAAALELRGTARLYAYAYQLAKDPAQSSDLLSGAKSDLETAVKLDPGRAGAWSALSYLYYQTEDVAAALLAARQAYERDAYLTTAPDVVWRLFIGSYDLEQFTQAKRWCLEGERRFARDYRFAECQLYLMTTDVARADAAEAWRVLVRIDSTSPLPRRSAEHHKAQMLVGAVLARAGLKDSARHVLVAARGGREVDPVQELPAIEAFAHTLLGDPGGAIDLL
ncbi:MAG TPA: serine/threonine-protein kinase, partial [Gemmatimonadales bacterium]|nr:serine/threonine-protein kinase [Gemmatimonadales bacterium]